MKNFKLGREPSASWINLRPLGSRSNSTCRSRRMNWCWSRSCVSWGRRTWKSRVKDRRDSSSFRKLKLSKMKKSHNHALRFSRSATRHLFSFAMSRLFALSWKPKRSRRLSLSGRIPASTRPEPSCTRRQLPLLWLARIRWLPLWWPLSTMRCHLQTRVSQIFSYSCSRLQVRRRPKKRRVKRGKAKSD